MKQQAFRKIGFGVLVNALALLPAAGVSVGQSRIVGEVLWSDTFTVGARCPSGYYSSVGNGTDTTRSDAAYMVEHAAGATQWNRPSDFSFNTPGDAVPEYGQINTGNDGAVGGFAQSGGGMVAFRGVLPSRVAFQMDARATCNSIWIATYSGTLPKAAGAFMVKFNASGAVTIAAYGGAEIDTGLTTGIGALNAQWHNYAVVFDRAAQRIEVFVDEVSRGTVLLAALGVAMQVDDGSIGMGCAGYVAWYDNVQAGVPATGGSDLALEAWRTERMNIEQRARRAPVLADGTIVKTGAGTLDLGGAAIARGTVDVREGVVAVDATDPGLPAQLQPGLAFWVDANVNVTAVDGKVMEWRDRREVGGGTLYPRAVAHGTGEAPTLVEGTGSATGMKLVDFGSFGRADAGWLRWVDSAGNRQTANARTVFYVLEAPNGAGPVIGDWDGATDDVHTGAAGWNSNIGYALSNVSGRKLSHEAYNAFVDDVACKASSKEFAAGLTTYAIQTSSGFPCSTFFNDRNARQGDAYGEEGAVWAANHQGGGRLAEALIWTRTLHETEFRMVNAYLMRKWKGGVSIGHARLAKDASLRVVADAARPPAMGALTGAGCVEVTGTGGSVRLAAMPEMQVTTPFDLAPGTSVVADEDARVGAFPVVARPGQSYAVTAAGVAATTYAEEAVVEKTGDGTLVATTLPTGAVLRVTAGTLRLAVPEGETEANLITNGDFEHVTRFKEDGTVGNGDAFGFNSTVPGWTLGLGVSNGASVTGLASCPGSSFATSYKTASGLTALFVQSDGYAETTFSVPAPGRYKLDFTAFRRNFYLTPFGLVEVQLDGAAMGRFQIDQLDPRSFSLSFPEPLAAGQHTLRFQGVLAPSKTNPGTNYDTMALIDDVRVTEDRSRLGANLVVNGGFETHEPLQESTPDKIDMPFQYAPSGTGWTFVDPDQPDVVNAGIAQAEGPWGNAQAPEGSCVAFLRQNGYFAQDIAFPEPGRYRLSFVMHGRFTNGGWWQWAGQVFKVFLGETLVAYLQGSPWEPERVVVELPAIDVGHLTQRLSFRGATTTASDSTTLFDDIRVERLPSAGLVNPSFNWPGPAGETDWQSGIVGAGWSFDTGVGERNQSGICGRKSPWAGSAGVPFGDSCAYIQMLGRIAQTVTVSEDGIYRVSFWTRRRASQYANHDFRVVCAGMTLGSVTTRDGVDWKRYSFRTPYLKAGVPFELAFEGINHGDSVDRASAIDEVSLERVADGATPEVDAFTDAKLELAEGTVLELDFEGVVELRSLHYARRQKCGMLNAEKYPFIRGAGTVYVRPKGLQLHFR